MSEPELSEQARFYLAGLRSDGRAANLGHLRSTLALTPEMTERAERELMDAGLIEFAGRGGRVRRTASGREVDLRAAARGGPLSADAQMLLALLPPDGSTIGGFRLRSLVDLDNDRYASALHELREVRAVRVGPGRGGSIARAEVSEEAPRRLRSLVRAEPELYEPFVDWLKSTWAGEEITFAQARVTASPAGRQRDSGRWSRPDVTAVQVLSFEWLPEKELEVSTFEVKRADDALRVESIFEAAAHGRWAHRASLVIEDPRGELPDRYLEEVRRFGLGLYVMKPRDAGSFDVDQLVEPRLQTPEPSELNELIEYFLQGEARWRNAYRAAIGR